LKEYDVVIVGGGMVGSMLAAALAATHSWQPALRIAVLENQQPESFTPGTNPAYDIRVSALSGASQNMFENVGAWAGILNRRACPYREMLVWDGEAAGRTHFKACDVDLPELGHIVENRVMQLALLDCLMAADNIDYLCPARLKGYELSEQFVTCELDNGLEPITTRLLVGADGAQSTVRQIANIEMERTPYPQHALVATVKTHLPQQDITWQRFQPTGPEALLPLCGSYASMVWYHTEEEVKRLRGLSDAEFLAAMECTFPEELGGIDSIVERSSFPIAKAHAKRYISDRVALIGDAAHTVHPLAGQGVNLGLLDAAALAETIMAAQAAGIDPGNRRHLRQYERWRRGENTLMISVLDGFYHAFKPQPLPFRQIRSVALNMADNGGPLKRFIMRYALGAIGHTPVLAKKSFM
jgi:2-octaprenyl-3-methyl-6-methoxy-1,4-benzoquinol hydroxylase